MASNEPTHVITDNPNVVPTGRDLALEAAATLAALLDNRRERTLSNQKFTTERKELEKRAMELIDEIRSGGTQLALKFGSTVATTRALASNAPTGDDQGEPGDPNTEEFQNEDPEADDEADTFGATH